MPTWRRGVASAVSAFLGISVLGSVAVMQAAPPALAADSVITLNASGGTATAGTGIKIIYSSGNFQVQRRGVSQLFGPNDTPPNDHLYNGIMMALKSPSGNTGTAVYPRLYRVGGVFGTLTPTVFSSYDTYLIDANGNRISGTSTTGSGGLISEMTYLEGGLTYRVTMRIDYTYPDDWMKQTFTVTIPAGNTKIIRLYNLYDTYLGASDAGPGFYQPASASAVEMVYTQQGNVFEGLARLSGPNWAGYDAIAYRDLLYSANNTAGPGYGTNLANIIDATPTTDNSIGVNWDYGTNGTTGSTSAPGSTITTTPAVGLFTFAQPPAPPAITTTTVGPGSVSTAFSQTLAGTINYGATKTWALSSGTLPPGLSLASDGTLSGTPTTAGSYTYTVSLTDEMGNQATKTFTTVINAAPTITTTSLVDGTIGSAYSQTVVATGGASPYAFTVSAGTLPAGLSIAGNGAITGTPTTAGASTFTVQVTDANSATATQQYTVNIAAVGTPSITTATLSDGAAGTAYSQTVAATGGTGPYSFTVSAGALPAGLNIASNGAITGTPTTAGSSTFTVRVTDANNQTATRQYTVNIAAPPAPTITTSSLPDGAVSTAYSQTVQATGGTGPYSFAVSAGTLPAGLSIANNGAITGTPTTVGSSTFTVTATDANNQTATHQYTVNVSDTPPAPPVPTWTLMFNGNGGSTSVSQASGPSGTWVNTPGSDCCTRSNYTFAGWNTSPDGTGLPLSPGAATQLTGDNTLYAQWQPIIVTAEDAMNATMVDSPVTGTVAASGILPSGTTFIAASAPANGTVVMNTDGTYTYTPRNGFSGVDSFTYTACHSSGSPCSTATVKVTVAGAPPAPIVTPSGQAVTDTLAVPGKTPVNAVYSLVTPTQNGVVDLAPDGEYTYTPNSGFSGTDSFTYQVCVPGSAACPTGTVLITVDGQRSAANAPLVKKVPSTSTAPVTFSPRTPVGSGSIEISSEGTSMWKFGVTDPGKGTWKVKNGQVSFAPDADFSGRSTVRFRVIAADGTASYSTFTAVRIVMPGDVDGGR